MDGPGDGRNEASDAAPRADARVLGQLLAAQNVLAVLPTAKAVAEFYARALVSVPGVAAARVCFPGASAAEGPQPADACSGCALVSAAPEGAQVPRGHECGLALSAEIRALPLATAGARYGFFVVHVGAAAAFEVYAPFVANLGNFVALFLENRQQRASLVERTAQLEAANQELEAFAYSASHDLRAPLRHIGGFVELLRRRAGGVLDEQGHHYLRAVGDAVARMDRLILDLLEFSRMGRFELSRGRVDLGTLAREVVEEHGPEVAGRTVRWRVGDLPVVSGDRAMLRVVLVNLVSNALKFTRPRARAEIEIGAEPSASPEQVVFVRDNGVGFDMAYVDRLFRVFERLHPSSEFEGTGVGLATVRRIVQRHGGRTWAEGAVGRGATFRFSLPARR